MKYNLSILIPARNEQFLAKTIKNILENIEGNTEVIAVLDGQWANPPIDDDPRVTVVYHSESIGQRAATNEAAKLSSAKYVMKCDAHCAFDKGFDVKMIEGFKKVGDDVTMVPIMRNLHAFDWVCPDGHRRYQSPSGPCKECGKETTQDVCWIGKQSPQSKSYCFDSEPHFQYFGEYCKRPEFKKSLTETGFTETMSLQGSCFMMTREKYWELDICSESFGSWGSQGLEVAIKTWLSGGRVLVNHDTWYAHMFRTQGGDFGFPYQLSGYQVSHAKKHARNLFYENRWDKAKYPLSWLIEKFWPIKGWLDADLAQLKVKEGISIKPGLTKGIIFYTDNQLNLKIAHKVQKTLKMISETKRIPIVSSSLKPMPNFGKNIHLRLERGRLAMFKQILAALEASESDVIFFCEHDVLYHPSHFDFIPEKKDVFYYNVNVWKVSWEDGHALWVNNCIQVSGLCGFREELIKHYKERVALAESCVKWDGNWGYEPGTPGKTVFPTLFTQETWMSEYPILDIRHSGTLSKNRWSRDQFRDKKCCEGWTETTVNQIKGWEDVKLK